MTEQFEIQNESEPVENSIPAESEIAENPEIIGIPSAPKKPKRKKIRTLFFRILILIYFILVIFSGYRYWTQPVRPEQIDLANKWWSEIGKIYSVSVLSDNYFEK